MIDNSTGGRIDLHIPVRDGILCLRAVFDGSHSAGLSGVLTHKFFLFDLVPWMMPWASPILNVLEEKPDGRGVSASCYSKHALASA